MALSDQAKALAELGAAARLDVFGINSKGTPQLARMEDDAATPTHTFPCYFSPVRSSDQLTEALFKDVHDTILRVARSAPYINATVGKNVVLIQGKNDGSDLVVRISELGHSGLNPEYVLGCKNVF
jgi:hypothetical protein